MIQVREIDMKKSKKYNKKFIFYGVANEQYRIRKDEI